MLLTKTIKTLFLCTLCATAIAADDSTQINDKFTQIKGTIDSINGELSAQRASIGELKADLQHNNDTLKKQIFEELKAIQRQSQYVYDNILAQHDRNGGNMNLKPLRNYDLQTPDGKMIFGEIEYFYVKEADATIEARIDTGASQSSISAQDIKEFERNGKKWLRFKIVHNDRVIEVEAPFVKQTKLRQSSIDGYSYRPIVRLNVKVGDYSTSAEFNLVDRSKMQFALLIGRPLLTDIAVVDVSRKYIQKRADKNGLLIINTDDFVANKKNNINVNEAYDKLQEENKGGQIATVAKDGTESMGTDPKLSLPSVSNKIESEEGKLPSSKVDKKKVQKPKQEQKQKAKNDKAHAKNTKSKLSKKEKAAKELAENYQKSQNAVD